MSIKTFAKRVLGIPNRIGNWVSLRRRKVSVGRDLEISGRIYVVADEAGHISIGDRVRINSGYKANPIGGDVRTILFARGNGRISIGNDCGISNASLFACESITIGNHVLLGGGTKIYDTDFHWLNYEKRISQRGGVARSVVIKDGAFIGAHTIILKGVTIGERAIVGAGSVVTKNIPDGEIWAGNPARFIRKVDHVE